MRTRLAALNGDLERYFQPRGGLARGGLIMSTPSAGFGIATLEGASGVAQTSCTDPRTPPQELGPRCRARIAAVDHIGLGVPGVRQCHGVS